MDSGAEFDARLEIVPERGAVVHVRGDLDLATAPSLERTISEADDPERLVIDLTECSFVDSTALRVLTEAARNQSARGGELALVVTDPGIRRILEITAVDTVLPVHPTVDAAL